MAYVRGASMWMVTATCAVGTLLSPGAAAAQSAAVATGLTVGINAATVSATDADDLSRLAGLTAGVFARIRAADWAAVQVESVYSRRGTEAEGGALRIEFDFIDIPVVAMIGRPSRGFWIETGPQLSFRLRARSRAGTAHMFDDLTDAVRSTDVGWTAGVGGARQRVTIQLRYTHGLLDLDRRGLLGRRVANRTLTAKAGWRIW